MSTIMFILGTPSGHNFHTHVLCVLKVAEWNFLQIIRMVLEAYKQIMQICDRTVTAHQQTTPDHWADLANPDMEPENFDTGFVDHHGLSLANGCQNCYSITPGPRLLHSPVTYSLHY